MTDLSKYTDYKTVLCVNILVFSQGKVLLVKRPMTKKVNPGKYCGIGGKVEPEESFFDAAKRELKEEAGLEIENLKPYGVTQSVDHESGAEWVHVNFMGVIPQMITFSVSEEGEFQWVDPSTLVELDMVSDLKEYAQILAKNEKARILGQFVFDTNGQLTSKHISVF